MCPLLLFFIIVFVLKKIGSAYKLLKPVISNVMKISSASLDSLYVNGHSDVLHWNVAFQILQNGGFYLLSRASFFVILNEISNT
jgi:hypothetical protein